LRTFSLFISPPLKESNEARRRKIDELSKGESSGESNGDPGHGFHPAAPGQYTSEPVKALLADISYGIASFFGFTETEKTFKDKNASATDKLVAIIFLGIAMSRGDGGGGERVAPSPNGRKGGLLHQGKIADVILNLQKEGFDIVEKEHMVKTPGGEKTSRFIDVQGTNSNTGEVK
jgi:hypothetical protein